MVAKHLNSNSPTGAMLSLLYSNSGKKNCPLNRDATIIGKSKGCDVVLEAPDISTLHCVITRNAGGFYVRDCNSRAGIRLNGDRIYESILHDEDILQVGPFSFQITIPEKPKESRDLKNESQIRRLKQKRENLTYLALNLRRQLLELRCQNPQAVEVKAKADAELLQQANSLKTRLVECDQRTEQLNQRERDLARDREILAREMTEFQDRVAAKEAELQEKEDHWQQQIQTLEEKCCRQEAQNAAGSSEGNTTSTQIALEDTNPLPQVYGELEVTRILPEFTEAEEARKLILRRKELDFYVRHLQRTRKRLDNEAKRLQEERNHLTRGMLEMQIEQRENQLAREHLTREQGDTAQKLEKQQAALVQAEEVLREQRANLMSMMEELKTMQKQVRSQNNEEMELLQQENQELREIIEELQNQPAPEPEPSEEFLKLKEDMEKLQHDNNLLRQLLDEKNALLEELEKNPPAPEPSEEEEDIKIEDPDSFEAELVKYRRELEQDRLRLNEEIQHLRQRNQEMDETIREMEMEMSKERAQLARERTRLERLREEIKIETDRLQRNGGLGDRLAPISRLRDEILNHGQK